MLHFDLDKETGILTLRPEGALSAADFESLARTVDPYLESQGKLEGLMLDAPSFPGWEDFSALLSHLRFVRDHHRRVQRIAVVSDSRFLSVAPKFAGHFVSAEVKTFDSSGRDAALAWLRTPSPPSV